MNPCPEQIVELLPWYINQTLDEKTMQEIEKHLQVCPSCRQRVETLHMLLHALDEQPQDAALPGIERVLERLPSRVTTTPTMRWLWMLILGQARVIHRDIWAASALVMTLGTLLTLLFSAQSQVPLGALPLVWVAPVVAAGGVAFLYGSSVAPAIEIELTAPVSPRILLLARLMLTFAFDLVLGLVGSLVLVLAHSSLSLWPLVTTWLTPMAFLSSLAFLLTVLTVDPNVGFVTGLSLWAIQSTGRMVDWIGVSWRLPNLTSAAARPWLWSLTLLLGGLALWAGGREEPWMRRYG